MFPSFVHSFCHSLLPHAPLYPSLKAQREHELELLKLSPETACVCLLNNLFPVFPLNMEGEKQISGTCFIWELFSLHDVITFQRPYVLIFMLMITCQYRDFGEHKHEKVS